ncbi:MAG: hypothetical protein K1Y36_10995 [Blastocatellia bacterium]|nr:hypothetical protein [Blastocatellia bacterium]
MVKKTRWIFLFLALGLVLGGSPATSEARCSGQTNKPPAVPFELPTPQGWRTETIPFPLGFAPSLPYKGVEELRFAPGFFKAGQEDMWSYVFVWYLEGKPALTEATFQKDFKAYFEGLAKAVEKPEKFDPAKATATLKLGKAVSTTAGRTVYEGTLANYDPFVTHDRLALFVKLEVLRCEKENRTVVLSQISPQPKSHPIWQTLNRISQGFACAIK